MTLVSNSRLGFPSRRRHLAASLVFGVLSGAILPSAMAKKTAADDTRNPAYMSVAISTAADPSGKPAPSAGFIHPGVLVNRAQLEEIKKRVAAGTEPQKSAFEKLKSSPFGALDYTPHPRDTVECGPFSKPDLGCKAEQGDCEAA